MSVPRCWTVEFEGNPLLGFMTPWVLTYFTIWIQELREKEEAMNTIWRIVVQEFALLTVE